MTVVTLRPDGTIDNAGVWVTVGAGSAHAALNDNSDASYVRPSEDPATPGSSGLRISFGTFALPAGAQVRSVQAWLRFMTNVNGGTYGLSLIGADGAAYNDAAAYTPNTIETRAMPAHTLSPDGDAWTQADIDALKTWMGGWAIMFYVTLRYYEQGIDVTYNERPTATVTAPTEGGTIANTTAPSVAWTYADPDGDVQERFRVRVFTAAQYGIGGFDPETSPAFHDSGEVVSSATTYQLPTLDNATTYRAYVKVADATPPGFAVKWSLWDNNQFTVNVVPPGVPTVGALAYSTVTHAVTGTVTSGSIPATGTGHRFRLERSIDGGATWSPVRNFTAVQFAAGTTGAGTVVPFTDYEEPRGAAVRYRARSTADVGGFALTSAWSATAGPVTATKAGCWNLKSPSDPTLNLIGLDATTQRLKSVSKIPTAVFAPQGRREPIVHQGAVQAKAYDPVEFFFDNDAEFAAFEALRTRREALLLQTTYGDVGLWEQAWVRLGDLTEDRVTYDNMNNSQFRFVTVQVLEVAAPAVT